MESAKINIRVIPKSSRSTIIIDAQGYLKAYLHSPPADGKANNELLSLLSKTLKIPKKNITIEHGLTSKDKCILILGITSARIVHMISNV